MSSPVLLGRKCFVRPPPFSIYWCVYSCDVGAVASSCPLILSVNLILQVTLPSEGVPGAGSITSTSLVRSVVLIVHFPGLRSSLPQPTWSHPFKGRRSLPSLADLQPLPSLADLQPLPSSFLLFDIPSVLTCTFGDGSSCI